MNGRTAAQRCPTCGQPSPHDWLFDFSSGTLWIDGRYVHLTPAEASIAGLLLRADGAPVPVSKLIGGVWGLAEPGDAAGTLYSHIFILRRKLAGMRLRLEHRRGPVGPGLKSLAAGGAILHLMPRLWLASWGPAARERNSPAICWLEWWALQGLNL